MQNTLLINLESFADINFPTDETGQKYITVLQYLGRLLEINLDEQERERVKQKICRFLKQREIDAAYEIVNENLRDKYEIYELP